MPFRNHDNRGLINKSLINASKPYYYNSLIHGISRSLVSLTCLAFILISVNSLKGQCIDGTITLLTNVDELPNCAIPGEVFTTTIDYNYSGELPASIDTIFVTEDSAPGFEIISYSPTEIVEGFNSITVSVVYNGDCNIESLFICEIKGAGGAESCSTIVSSLIPCCAECQIVPLIDLAALPTCAVPGEVFTATLEYEYNGELPASIDTIIVTAESAEGFEILSYGPTEIQAGKNAIDVSVVYSGDCNDESLFICEVIGAGGAASCSTIVSSTIPCCEDECQIVPILDLEALPMCAVPGEVFTTTLEYEYNGELPASIDTIFVTAESAQGFEILSYGPIEIQAGKNAIDVSVVYNGDCNDESLFICEVIGAGGASSCSTIVSSTIPCCDDECQIVPIIDLEALPMCAVPGEVFTTTLQYEYNGQLPASIDTIFVTTESAEGFEILSYGPTEIETGLNEIEVSVVYNGDCNDESIFICEVIGGGGAASCSTIVSSTIPCCDEECQIVPIIDLEALPMCAVPGEVFTTTLQYEYNGQLPASIDTIFVTTESAEGFEIISYGPTEIQAGLNEIEVSVVYNGDCNDESIFICEVIGGGGAASCSTIVSSTIPCCDEECQIVPLLDLEALPMCAVPGEVFTTTLEYEYTGSLPASIDTIFVTAESAQGFEILSYGPTEIQAGKNAIDVSVVYNGDCNDESIFICEVIGGGGAASCSTVVSSTIPCCDEECNITPITDLESLPTCAVPGEVFTTTLEYDYNGSLPASIDTIYVTTESAEGFEILSYGPTEIQEGRNTIDVSVVYNGDCNDESVFICDVIGGGGAASCSVTVSSVIPCCEDCGLVDTDADGVYDDCDNCKFIPNPGQEDEDGNGLGDVCEEPCEIMPIIDLNELPTCLTPGEIFTTSFKYEFTGTLPARIDTIIVREDSDPGFQILDYSPKDIVEGENEVEVSVLYEGDCDDSNLFICDVIGSGGAAACSVTISSRINCCGSFNLITVRSYPNPTADIMFVSVEEVSNYKVEIYSIEGEMLMSTDKMGQDFFIIHTKDLDKGTYVLKVSDLTNNKVGMERIAIFR